MTDKERMIRMLDRHDIQYSLNKLSASDIVIPGRFNDGITIITFDSDDNFVSIDTYK